MYRRTMVAFLVGAALWLCGCGMPAALAASSARFSHKTHAPLRMACTKCHSVEGKGTLAGFPGKQQCKVCHTDITEEDSAFPTKRVYTIPDFVYFSHKRHLDAKAKCAKCHGNVASADTVTLEVPPKMKFCVDCHNESKAPVECFICHDLGQ